MLTFRTPDDVLNWLDDVPDGTTFTKQAVYEIVARLPRAAQLSPSPQPESTAPQTWRERIWTVPAETQMSADEVAEAVGRSMSWVYQRTMTESVRVPLPHRKLDGVLIFAAGEIRGYLEQQRVLRQAGVSR